jgi:uncharacterized phage infection (PIP) family protein YhgE
MPESTSNTNSSATGVTATHDEYEGAKNTSSYASTGASALALRNEGLIRVLDKADNAAGTQSMLGKYNTGLAVVGAGANAVNQGLNADATTTTGKVVTGVAAGGVSFAASKLHPGVAAVDLATGGAVSQNLNNGVNATVTIVDGLATGNSEGMENLHQENLNGENGVIAQEAAEAGDFWADNGVRGGLSELGDAVGYFFTGR